MKGFEEGDDRVGLKIPQSDWLHVIPFLSQPSVPCVIKELNRAGSSARR